MIKIKGKKICKVGKKIIKVLLKIIVIVGIIYGLIYAPYKQLQFSKIILENNIKALLVEEARDIASCEALSYQQLQQAEEIAKKEKQEVTEENKKAFLKRALENCLVLSGRSYLNQMEASKQKEEVENSEK